MERRQDRSLLGGLGQRGGRSTEEDDVQRPQELDMAGLIAIWLWGQIKLDSRCFPGASMAGRLINKEREDWRFQEDDSEPSFRHDKLEHAGTCDQ